MYRFIRGLLKSIKSAPLFSGSFLVLSLILGTTQYQYWFGSYSYSNLKDLKKEIALVELETDLIKATNEDLVQEKKKLNSGKDALEGVARTELGLIKPGEKFYVFKETVKEDNSTDK